MRSNGRGFRSDRHCCHEVKLPLAWVKRNSCEEGNANYWYFMVREVLIGK